MEADEERKGKGKNKGKRREIAKEEEERVGIVGGVVGNGLGRAQCERREIMSGEQRLGKLS